MKKNMAEKEIDPFYMYVHLIKYFQTVQGFVADFIALDTPPCDSNIQTASRSFCLSVNWNRNQFPTCATSTVHPLAQRFILLSPAKWASSSVKHCLLFDVQLNLISNYTSYFNQMKLFVQNQRCKKRN